MRVAFADDVFHYVVSDVFNRSHAKTDLIAGNGKSLSRFVYFRRQNLDAKTGGVKRVGAGSKSPVTEAFGWTVRFEVDPWQVVVNDRAVETYSESEQYLIGLAIQLAIAQVSGLSFAVVDRLDVLDAAHRAIATKILMDCNLEQVFILSTREPEFKLPSAKAGLIAHRFQSVDGWTQIAESVGV